MKKYLGKRRMNQIMSKETNVPYKDVADFGKYTKYSNSSELLELGGYTLRHSFGKLVLFKPCVEFGELIYKKIDICLEEEE